MTAIDLSLEDIYNGRATMIKDKKYFATQAYIEPFIDRVDKLCQGNFIVKAQPANQISITSDGNIVLEDMVFNRVWVQAILPDEYAYENHQQSMNMLYALDTRKPLVKFFKNALNMACLNMCVFNPEHLNVQEILPETPVKYDIVNEILSKVDDTKIMLEALEKIVMTRIDVTEGLGDWIDKCINMKFQSQFGTIKLPESLPIEVYKDLFYNKDSRYYTDKDSVNGFEIYNAFTDIITNDKGKDIVNKFEKIFLVSQLLGLK